MYVCMYVCMYVFASEPRVKMKISYCLRSCTSQATDLPDTFLVKLYFINVSIIANMFCCYKIVSYRAHNLLIYMKNLYMP